MKATIQELLPRTAAEVLPGWYENVPNEVYHSWDFMSSGRLNTLAKRTPAHLRHEMLTRNEPTPAMVRGSVVHMAILEPALLDTKYCARPAGLDLRTKDGKAAYADFCAANPGKEVLSAEDFENCKRMRDAVWAHPFASELLRTAAATEISGVFIDPDTGVKARIRPDAINKQYKCTIDLKTCEDASEDAFSRFLYNYGGHRQGRFYLDGCAALGLPYETHVIIAVEATQPHAVACYMVDQPTLNVAATELQRLKALYKQCVESGEWPGYALEVKFIGLPAWAFKRIDN